MNSLDQLLAPYTGAIVAPAHSTALSDALAEAADERAAQIPQQRGA
jgi:hypothetical protein